MMEQALAEYLINAAWQVPLLAGSAWLLLWIVKPGPQIQHRIWLAVLGLAVLLPVVGTPRATSQQDLSTTTVAQQQLPLAGNSQNLQWPWHPAYPQAHTIHLGKTMTHWLVRLYLATVAWGLLRITRAWRSAGNLAARSRETSLHKVELARYSRRFGVKAPALRESSAISSPMLVGLAAPILLLPEGFAQFTPEQVEAVLCHELAHLKRRDYLMNMVCQVAALPLTWHPVVLEVTQRIRLTRELVCDAMAAQEMKSRIGYARCLLALAESMLGESQTIRHAQTLGLFSNNAVEERVMRLMETTTMSFRAKVARAATGAVVMLAAGSLAAVFHVTPTMAEPRADAAPQVVQATPAPPPALPPQAQSPAAPVAHNHSAHRYTTHGRERQLSAAEQERIDHQMTEAKRQIAKATAQLNSPGFRKQIEQASRQAAKATAQFNSPEFRKQIEQASQQAAKATAQFNSPEFRKQIEQASRQAAEAAAKLNSGEFKKQMEDAQRQISEAQQMFDTPQFKHQMEELQKEFQSDEFRRKWTMGSPNQGPDNPATAP